MESANNTLTEIGFEMGDPESPNTSLVPRDKVLRWMQNSDIEVMGRTFYFITDRRHYLRIDPPLQFENYHPFVLRYYERCFRENPEDKTWALGRYPAGWSFVNWFVGLWNDRKIPRRALQDLKDLLAGLYKDGDSALRECLVTATLEHLFERRQIAKYFTDWQQDSTLRIAYEDGMAWSKAGGRTSLGRLPKKKW